MKFQNLRGGGYFLANSKNFQLNKSKKSAFSLIELSIVLIIIGLLVAGITGGASLIESAKIRSLMNEVRGYQQAFYSFKAAKDRLPGDIDGSGILGGGGGQSYDNNSFGGNYVSSNTAYGVPQDQVGPFVDLYLEKIIDFEPKKTKAQSGALTRENGGSPKSKAFPDLLYTFWRGWTDANVDSLMYNTPQYNYFSGGGSELKVRFLQSLDEKMDDGLYNNGSIRVKCGSSSGVGGQTDYDTAEYCSDFYLKIE